MDRRRIGKTCGKGSEYKKPRKRLLELEGGGEGGYEENKEDREKHEISKPVDVDDRNS